MPASLTATVALAGLMGALWIGAIAMFPAQGPLYLSAGLFVGLVAISWYDFDHYRIPNWLSLPLLTAGIAMTAVWAPDNLAFSVFGAIAGYGLIWAMAAFWRQVRGQDGIGMGDAKLLGAAGAWLGVLGLPCVTLIASGAALLVIVASGAARGTGIAAGTRIAFGPYIALGFWCVWLARGALGI